MGAGTASRYRRDGFVAPIRVASASEAHRQRDRLEWAEARVGPLHYRDKVHTILTAPWRLLTSSVLLDAVGTCIGPDILVYNAMYIIKEPGSAAKVNWHQDLTYRGLEDDDAQVSAWIALAPATAKSGCMRMIPGNHRHGRCDHVTPAARAADDVLDLGQSIEGVDESAAVSVPLEPGEASLHHGWTVHASSPNRSNDRRIGLNVQFIAPHNRQVMHGDDTVVLVRGVDRCHHFGVDRPATLDLDPVALEQLAGHAALIKGIYGAVRDAGPA